MRYEKTVRETLIQSLSDFTLEFLYMTRNSLTRIASYLRKAMTKSCIKILVKSDSAIESAFPCFSNLRGAFRHPERSEMSDVRKCKGRTVRTELKDLAPHHHFSFLIQARLSSIIKGQHAPRTVKNLSAFAKRFFTVPDRPSYRPFAAGPYSRRKVLIRSDSQ